MGKITDFKDLKIWQKVSEIVLEVKNLSVSYWGKAAYVEALKNISLNLNKGEILGVVGESGSGKSTLAFSALNLLPLDAKKKGSIIFKNRDIFALKEGELSDMRGNQIGLIFQEPASSFNPVLSIGYQFEEILIKKIGLKNKKERSEVIFDSFNKVKLYDAKRIIKSYPHQLSGGQLQRIAIAMAISLDPKILIADEPTSSLDVTIESQIVYLFKELRDALGLSIIFITHNLDLVKVLCDRVLVLYEGCVREVKEMEELFRAPQDEYTKSLLDSLKKLEDGND